MIDSPEAGKPLFARLQERLAASRFLTVSVLIHAILVVMGGSIVIFRQGTVPEDFTASDGALVAADDVQVTPPVQPPDLMQEFRPEAPTITGRSRGSPVRSATSERRPVIT